MKERCVSNQRQNGGIGGLLSECSPGLLYEIPVAYLTGQCGIYLAPQKSHNGFVDSKVGPQPLAHIKVWEVGL